VKNSPCQFMLIHTITQTPLGADLSRTSPMYRPSVAVPMSAFYSQCASSALSSFGCCLAAKSQYFTINMKRCIPGNHNSIFNALMRRATFSVYLKCSLSRITLLGRDSQIVVYSNRLNSNRFACTNNSPIDRGCVKLTIKRNLAP